MFDIKHPNIIELYYYIESSEYIYIILEYADGGNLFEYLNKNKYLSE